VIAGTLGNVTRRKRGVPPTLEPEGRKKNLSTQSRSTTRARKRVRLRRSRRENGFLAPSIPVGKAERRVAMKGGREGGCVLGSVSRRSWGGRMGRDLRPH